MEDNRETTRVGKAFREALDKQAALAETPEDTCVTVYLVPELLRQVCISGTPTWEGDQNHLIFFILETVPDESHDNSIYKHLDPVSYLDTQRPSISISPYIYEGGRKGGR